MEHLFSDSGLCTCLETSSVVDQDQDNLSEWSDLSTRGLLFQRDSNIKYNKTCWSSIKQT
jgi:hypothetical protein